MSDVVLLGSRNAGVAAVGTTARYFGVGMGMFQGFLTELNSQIIFREAGTLSKLFVRVTSNDHTTSLTARLRKDTGSGPADGNQTVSFGASETGTKLDSSNTDSVAAGDKIDLSVVGVGGTAAEISIIGFLFTPASGQPVRLINQSNASITFVDSTQYTNIGRLNYSATEGLAQFRVLGAGSLKNLRVLGTNAGSTDVIVNSRVQSADGTVTFTHASAGTGGEDTTHTDSLSEDDVVGLRVTTGAGHSSFGYVQILMDLALSTGFQYIGTAVDTVVHNASETKYFPIAGDFLGHTTQANVQAQALSHQRLSKLSIYVPTNTVSAASTFVLQQNGVDTALTITIPSNTTGTFQDSSHIVQVLPTDSLNFKLVTGASGTSLTIAYVVMLSSEPIDQAIWELDALTAPALEDLLVSVDDPAGTPATKKMTLTALATLGVTNVVVQTKTVGSGTYTPTAGMKKVLAIAVGGGGGGAGGINTDSAGGGGGGGGTVIRLMTAADIGASKAYVVGAGGAATSNGNATTLDTAGALMNAGGGQAGTAGATFSVIGVTVAGGAGGTASNGNLNIPGGAGRRGVIFSGADGRGGPGGRSAFGFGGASGGTNVAGSTGQAYGGGGAGGHASATADRAGGAGADGILYLIEFID